MRHLHRLEGETEGLARVTVFDRDCYSFKKSLGLQLNGFNLERAEYRFKRY